VRSASLAASSPAVQLRDAPAYFTREPAHISRNVRDRGFACLRALGGSMFPWIRPGDLLFVRKCQFDAVSSGDVILFEQNGRYFAHRVLGRMSAPHLRNPSHENSFLVTKGDALDGNDPPVTSSCFLGRVIRIHRRRSHIDLQSLSRILLGRILARLSPQSALFYRPMRKAKRLLLVWRTR
jgi:signal peptidase I